ncbi:DinB family protein [Streptomyces luteogriseus]|uniref:DinB family protein n=1 Tax=Streptomyces luteogriseus TaxID=68233 RepID=UPI003F4CB5E8
MPIASKGFRRPSRPKRQNAGPDGPCSRSSYFGGQGVDSETFAYAGTADEAPKQLDEMYGRWNAGIRELSDADLENAPTVGPERFPTENRVLHVNRELIHHGAEISLLRDLYRWQDGAVPRRT